jgi:Caspase domain
MRTLYALLAGINRYRADSVPDLRGCVRDVEHALAYLGNGVPAGTELRPLILRDEEATRSALINAIRFHLGRARKDDTALFWFSGHGSQADVPDWAWFREPTGRLQTLVCADSRAGGVPDLWDKELSVLLDDVARRAGHVAVVLDSCHSDGATRELNDREPAARSRAVPGDGPRSRDSLIPELVLRGLGGAQEAAQEHLALAASRSFEAAQEMPLEGEQRGLFSWALLRALHRLGSSASYRELLAAAQAEVERRAYRQVPQLRPAVSELADHAFLDRIVTRPAAGMRMRYAAEGWEIDAGAVHGLPSDLGVRVGMRGDPPLREAAVTRVLAERSLVDPVGAWMPDREEQYPVVVTEVPLPVTTVALDGDPAGAARLRAAILAAGPDGDPSPHLRPVAPDDTAGIPDLRATISAAGSLVITDRHGDRLGDEIPDVHGDGSWPAVTTLEHIARWHLLMNLENPAPTLLSPVRIEVVVPEPGETVAPKTGPVRELDPDGVHRLFYRRGERGWVPPEIFIRLHNTGDQMLYCALLDLTPRFGVHATLFPGDFIAPGERGCALDGRRIQAFLPAGMAPEPGVAVRDRLKLFVAEEQFSVRPFLMPALGRPVPRGRGGLGARGLLERLGGAAVHRDLGDANDLAGAYDWTTTSLTLVTEVPD